MVQRPILLLTFANQQDDYLAKLKEESSELFKLLRIHHDNQLVEVIREESASVDNITFFLNNYRERIVLFHYAGHAGGEHLHFEGGEGHASGLAELLGALPNLELVFLNGCSTQGQVDYLLEQGVKRVIATAVPIDDTRAKEFAQHFYSSLSNKNTVEGAFKFAVGSIRTAHGGAFEADIVPYGTKASHQSVHDLPWGLYLNKEVNSNWILPLHLTTKVKRPEDSIEFQVNRYMVDIISYMADYNERLKTLVYDANEEWQIDDREALSLIIEYFPWPIGVQVRLLLSNDESMNQPTIERLEQLMSTYLITSRFLYYTVLSQLWDEKRMQALEVRPDLLKMLYLEREDYNRYNHFLNFLQILRFFKESGVTPFIQKYDEMVEEFDLGMESELHQAYQFFESLREQLHDPDKRSALEGDLYQNCADGEYFLSALLIKFAFLVQYDLVTIRDIHISNYRYLKNQPIFNHFMGRLNAKVTDIALGRKPEARPYTRFFNNASVVLTANLEDTSSFLNLSPFIVDKNAFAADLASERPTEQQLFMLGFRDAGDYVYYTTIHNFYTAQERESDQFTTAEGSGEEDDSDTRGRRRGRGRRGRRNTTQEERRQPYKVLKEQLQIFEHDLSIR